MMLPQNFIEEVKSKTSMVELANEHTKLRKISGEVWQGRCPHPKHEDEDPSFTVWEKQNTWCCYGCHVGKRNDQDNYGSDSIAFIRWLKNKSFTDSIIYLAERLDLPLPDNKHMATYNKNKELMKIYNKSLLNNVGAVNYLRRRGMDIADINDWMLGYDGVSILMPLFDRYRNVLGFSRRRLKDTSSMSKYKNPQNSEIFNKGDYLYGLHNIDTSYKEIRISEGPFDAMLAHKHGVKNVVALQGTSLTNEHAEVIAKLKLTPVFCFDGDPAGRKGIENGIKTLSAYGIKPKVCILPNHSDLADLSSVYKDKTEEYINSNAVLYSQYLMSDIMSQYDARVNEVKSTVAPRIQAVLDVVEDKDERFVLMNYIKDRTGLNFGESNQEKRRRG